MFKKIDEASHPASSGGVSLQSRRERNPSGAEERPHSSTGNSFPLSSAKGDKEFLLAFSVVLITVFGALYYGLDPRIKERDERNNLRKKEMQSIVDLVSDYEAKNGKIIEITGKDKQIGSCKTDSSLCSKVTGPCLDISKIINQTIPFDPVTGSEKEMRYAVRRDQSGNVVVIACDAENGEAIEVGTR